MNEPNPFISKLVCNKDEVCFRINVHDTTNPTSSHDMGRGCDFTIWLRIPARPNYGLVSIWNRLDRDTSPCERYRFVCQRTKE